MIKKIDSQTIEEIEKGTVKTLPDDPSKQGYSPDVIKRRMYQGHRKVVDEVNKVIDDINVKLAQAPISAEEPTDPEVRFWFKVIEG